MKYQRLSTQKVNKIISCFCSDITATAAAKIANVNRNTVNAYYNEIRDRIFERSLLESPKLGGEFEVDESYFGARRVRGKRGRGAAGKTPVFGLLKRNDNVYVKIVRNCSKEQLMPIILGKVLSGSVINSDGWKSYDGLILNGYEHYRVYHSENEFARGKNHVNGIENFWSCAKRRLAKFNGCAPHRFVIHLKECEFRYNHRNDDLVSIIKKLLKQPPRC
jgi:transposase-like protein